MILVIPENVFRERLLPYAAKLDRMSLDYDTIYQVASMVMEKCVDKNVWDREFIYNHANTLTWEVFGDHAFEVFNMEDINGEYNKVTEYIETLIEVVCVISIQMEMYFKRSPEVSINPFIDKDPLIVSEVSQEEDLLINVNFQE